MTWMLKKGGEDQFETLTESRTEKTHLSRDDEDSGRVLDDAESLSGSAGEAHTVGDDGRVSNSSVDDVVG